MGVSCQILINKPREGVHKAGRPVTGVVRYAMDEPGRYKDIVISLIGKGKCSWDETRKRNGRNETITYTGRELYTSQHLSICQKGSGPAFILPIGAYENTFSFVLPNNIPSSYESNTCKIRYKLVLTLERPNVFSFHQKFSVQIDVIGNVNPISPEGVAVFELQKALFKPFKKRTHHIHLKAEISNTIFSPGRNAELTYVVTNDSDVTVPSVRTELICNTTYTADCGRRKQKKTTIKECTVDTPSIPDNAVANLSNALPILGSLYSIQNARIMFNEYKVKVTLRVPMPHWNASTEIPIVIGEKYGADDVELYIPEAEDEPPSYFQVMNEDKDND